VNDWLRITLKNSHDICIICHTRGFVHKDHTSTTKNAYGASYLEAARFRHHNRAKPIKEMHSIRQEIRHEIKAQNLHRTYSRMSMMLPII
jgi:hypothetical protein